MSTFQGRNFSSVLLVWFVWFLHTVIAIFSMVCWGDYHWSTEGKIIFSSVQLVLLMVKISRFQPPTNFEKLTRAKFDMPVTISRKDASDTKSNPWPFSDLKMSRIIFYVTGKKNTDLKIMLSQYILVISRRGCRF